MEYIGLDCHKQYSIACKFDDETGELQHLRLNNHRAEFEKLFSSSVPRRVVLEAGRAAYAIYDTIADLVPEVLMANPLQVKAIAWAVVKTDKVDAETLNKLLRADVVPTVYIRSQENRRGLYVLRQRQFWVKVRTMTKNRIHALIDRQSETIRESKPRRKDLFTGVGRRWLNQLQLPAPESTLLKDLLAMLDFLDRQIKQSDKLVSVLFKSDPIAQRLATIPGIGQFLAVLIRAEVDDIKRFPSDKKFHAYCGLVPTIASSADKTYHGRLIRGCNHWLKWALIEAVIPAVNSDAFIKKRYQSLASRKAHNIAKAGTAKQIATLVYKIWRQNRVYSPEKPLPGNSTKRMALKIA
jgi:transposase